MHADIVKKYKIVPQEHHTTSDSQMQALKSADRAGRNSAFRMERERKLLFAFAGATINETINRNRHERSLLWRLM